jgi:hypothetical protein
LAPELPTPLSVKTRFDLIPFRAVAEIADVLEFGAEKYSANNWCRGTRWGRYFAALCRHIFAWWAGEDRDPETGYSHLAHAGCCLLFLLEYQHHGWGEDDRFLGPDGRSFVKHDGYSELPQLAHPAQQETRRQPQQLTIPGLERF